MNIEYRWADEKYDRLPELVTELVRLNVDIIYAVTVVAALAAMRATSTIPVVFVGLGDPLSAGLVAGLARPGGNVTGLGASSWNWAASDWSCSRKWCRASPALQF